MFVHKYVLIFFFTIIITHACCNYHKHGLSIKSAIHIPKYLLINIASHDTILDTTLALIISVTFIQLDHVVITTYGAHIDFTFVTCNVVILLCVDINFPAISTLYLLLLDVL